jgi:arsenate reductase
MNQAQKKRVLFICTHNSARSHMAEGFIRYFYNDRYDASSGGSEPSRVNPYAIKVMGEVGIDISGHKSKSIKQFLDEKFDYVVIVCDQANEACPFFPGAKNYIHKGFQDPSLAKGTEKEMMEVFRGVRDEIKDWIEETFGKGTHSS